MKYWYTKFRTRIGIMEWTKKTKVKAKKMVNSIIKK